MTWAVGKMTWLVKKVSSGLKWSGYIVILDRQGSNGLRYHVNWVDNDADVFPHITAGQLHLVDHHMKFSVAHQMDFQKLKACPSNLSSQQSQLFNCGLISLPSIFTISNICIFSQCNTSYPQTYLTFKVNNMNLSLYGVMSKVNSNENDQMKKIKGSPSNLNLFPRFSWPGVLDIIAQMY